MLPCNNFMKNNYATVLDNEKCVLHETQTLTKLEISSFEIQSRLQNQSKMWYKIRKMRLTASNIGEIYKRRKDNQTLVQRLKSTRRVTTAAVHQGIASEPLAAKEYASLIKHEVNLYSCGVVVNFWSPWLAATPDREVYNPVMDPKFGPLEIKSSSVKCA
ncbi:hypothetical protein ACF0H5_014801 [Mactra antiquata]